MKLQPCGPAVAVRGAQCGTYPVWEDRAGKKGRRIGLNVVVLPATGAEREADPVVFLAGGPGQAATTLAVGVNLQYAELRKRRDLVFVDQRGTGKSNPLECRFYGDPPDVKLAASQLFPAAAVTQCRAELEKTADLRFYTTDLAMDDVNDVRAWLGYRMVNVWGGSYGSMAAQVYMRRHGETVRAAVLAGVAPVDELIPLHHAMAGQQAVNAVFAECRADAACRGAYPDVEREFKEVFARVQKGVTVEVRDRRAGKMVMVEPSAPVLAEGIRHYLYSADGKSLPRMIHEAYGGNYAPLVQIAVDDQIAFSRQLAYGLLLSVTCSEDVPFIKEAAVKKETAGTFLGDARVRVQQKACALWVRGAVPKDVHKLVRSGVPVLLLSGERDPVTPPSFAERVAEGLPNSKHVVFPQGGHGNWGRRGVEMVTAFVEAGRTGQ